MMQVRRMRAPLAAAAALSLLSLFSCASAPRRPLLDAKPVRPGSFGPPETHALVFGFVENRSGLLARAFSGAAVNDLEMIQLNPALPAMLVTPARDRELFYTQPLPVGSALKLYLHSTGYSSGKTKWMNGVQWRRDTDALVAKPGLLYLGSLKESDMRRDESGKLVPADTYMLRDVGDRKERDALRKLLAAYAGSAWEPVIKARIEELGK
jgi:hypothetical protein